MITAEVLKQSVSVQGHVLTTFKVTFPRIILSEVLTHRIFSRNTSSSRAIPFEKMLEAVVSNPFIPYFWQKRHKGMQGTEYITDEVEIRKNITTWIHARDAAIKQAEILNSNGVTKQLANRLLEPFQWVTMIISVTDLDQTNFFNLRCPKYRYEYYTGDESLEVSDVEFESKERYIERAIKDKNWYPKTEFQWLEVNQGQAEIHFQMLAEKMYDAFTGASRVTLKTGEWHIPFDNEDLDIETAIKVSTARCARISYTTIGEDKEFSVESDLKLYQRLLEDGHMSPFEHCAMAINDDWDTSNFKGFLQHRKFVEE